MDCIFCGGDCGQCGGPITEPGTMNAYDDPKLSRWTKLRWFFYWLWRGKVHPEHSAYYRK